MGAINVGFYFLGYHHGSHQKEDGVEVTEENRSFIRDLMEWRNYK